MEMEPLGCSSCHQSNLQERTRSSFHLVVLWVQMDQAAWSYFRSPLLDLRQSRDRYQRYLPQEENVDLSDSVVIFIVNHLVGHLVCLLYWILVFQASLLGPPCLY